MWGVLGFEKNKRYFENAVKNGILSHAYIFWGPAKIGKKQFALDLYCLANRCGCIKKIEPDLNLVAPQLTEDETRIYIEDVRKIKLFLSPKPYVGPYKFAVIDDADRLTPEASNALLKILEEPPPSSIIILITSKPKFLLSTVQSRCNLVKFLPLSQKEITNYLDGCKISLVDREFLIKIGRGRIGWIKNVVDNNAADKIRKQINEFGNIVKAGIFEKIQFAKKLSEDDEVLDILDNYIHYISAAPAPIDHGVAKKILRLHTIISQPQFNRRLALENFLINI